MKTLTKILVTAVTFGFAVSSFAGPEFFNGNGKHKKHGLKSYTSYSNSIKNKQMIKNNNQVLVGAGFQIQANVNHADNYNKMKVKNVKKHKMIKKYGGKKYGQCRSRGCGRR